MYSTENCNFVSGAQLQWNLLEAMHLARWKTVFPFYVFAQDRFTSQKTVSTISNSKVISDFPSLRD